MNDSSVQARVLCHQIGIFNMHREQELAQRIEWIANQSGASLEDTRIRMVEAWSTYQRAIASGRLKWFYPTPIKFFESNLWHDSNLWPVDRGRSDSWTTVGM